MTIYNKLFIEMTQEEIVAFVESNVVYSDNDIKIMDGYTVSKKDYDAILKCIYDSHPDSPVLTNRCWGNIKCEWATHSFLYKRGLWVSHTKDVDINYPLSVFEKIAYAIFGTICKWLIK